MEEYIFKNAPLIDWQKWMNQWKHNYTIEVIHSQVHDDGTATILLKRIVT